MLNDLDFERMVELASRGAPYARNRKALADFLAIHAQDIVEELQISRKFRQDAKTFFEHLKEASDDL